MENYIVINGKKAELTEEQVKALGIEVKKENPFARASKGGTYYRISVLGDAEDIEEEGSDTDEYFYHAANYCTDKELMHQRALHEILDRLLLRFTYENGWSEDLWKDDRIKYRILYDTKQHAFVIDRNSTDKGFHIYFNSRETAERAIEEVIKPFMKEHPDFIW